MKMTLQQLINKHVNGLRKLTKCDRENCLDCKIEKEFLAKSLTEIITEILDSVKPRNTMSTITRTNIEGGELHSWNECLNEFEENIQKFLNTTPCTPSKSQK